jgi:hypothetical protein
MLLPLLPAILLALLSGSPGAAAPQQLPLSPVAWIPVAAVAVLAIITIAGIVYALSGAIGSQNARNWSKAQIYEGVLSLIMIMIFGSFSYLFFINPQGAYRALDLVPCCTRTGTGSLDCTSACPSGTDLAQIDCANAASVFTLATCDLSMFNHAMFNLGNIWLSVAYLIGVVPELTINIGVPSIEGLGFAFSVQVGSTFFEVELTALFIASLTVLLLQQIQLLLISSSILILSLFITLGLVARTFGFTRTFGGAMIAFALGLGLVYPMLVSITYGFVDVQGNVPCILSPSVFSMHCNAVNFSISDMISLLGAIIFSGSSSSSAFLASLGYFLAGLTFVPFLNFIIVDAFIIDFSQAVGERMDFMGLLAGIV